MPPKAKQAGTRGAAAAGAAAARGLGAGVGAAMASAGLPKKRGHIDLLGAVQNRRKEEPGLSHTAMPGTPLGHSGPGQGSGASASSGPVGPAALEGPIQIEVINK